MTGHEDVENAVRALGDAILEGDRLRGKLRVCEASNEALAKALGDATTCLETVANWRRQGLEWEELRPWALSRSRVARDAIIRWQTR